MKTRLNSFQVKLQYSLKHQHDENKHYSERALPILEKLNFTIMISTALMFLTMCFQNISAQQLDTITDNRDGQKYRVVKTGEQWWMAQNFYYIP
jgi:hypothetical protein